MLWIRLCIRPQGTAKPALKEIMPQFFTGNAHVIHLEGDGGSGSLRWSLDLSWPTRLFDPLGSGSPSICLRSEMTRRRDSISGFEAILNGDCDELPENAFMYVGSIDEAIDKAKKIS